MNTLTPEDRDAPRELVGIIAPGDWRQAREALDAFPDQPWAPEFVRSLLDALDQAEAERDHARAQVDRVRALHRKHTPDPEQLPTFVVCTSCWSFDGDFIPYPCPTIKALDGEQ